MTQYEMFHLEVECPIAREVMNTIASRANEGMITYGKTMARKDLSTKEWINHAIEEALDLACYLTRLKKDIVKLDDTLDKLGL